MKHLFTDVDGCLSGSRGTAFDLNEFTTLKELLSTNNIKIYFISGRSQPYLEALSQAFNNETPCFVKMELRFTT